MTAGWADLLLRWCSERGEGSLDTFRAAYAWLARTHDLDTSRSRAHAQLAVLSALGHAEVDWATRRWSIAPPAVTELPLSGGCGLITGSRTALFEGRIQDAADSVGVEIWPTAHHAAPTSLLVQSAGAGQLRALATALDTYFVPCAALQLAALLPVLPRDWPPASPPSPDAESLRRFDPAQVAYTTTASSDADGLYAEEAWGRTRYLQRRAGRWSRLPRDVGAYSELARAGRHVLRWQPAGLTGVLRAPSAAPLPPLQARAAVLSLGILPVPGTDHGYVAYRNVPYLVAWAVARSLGQPAPDRNGA